MSYEKSVIGSLMLDPNVIETIKGIVNPSDFGNQHLGEALRAIYELSEKGDPVDVLSVGDELGNQKYNTNINASDLADMQDDTPSAANVEYYAEQVRDGSKRRAVQSVARCANEADTGAEAVDEALKTLLSINTEQKKNQVDINDALISVINQTEAKFDAMTNGIELGLKTGLTDLDEQIGGLEGGRLYVLGARPAMGKSVVGLNLALQAVKKGIPTVVFSLEMPTEEVTYRMICAASGLNTRAQNNMQESDWGLMTAGFNVLKDKPLTIDDSAGYTVSYLKNSIRTHASKHDDSFYVIDYLQLINIKGDNRVQGIGQITRELKLLAKELNRPILILSQLNRSLESRPDKRPIMADLRESGEIEQDADVIIFIYRDEIYNENSEFKGVAELLVRKNRSGETGIVRVKSEMQCARFSDLGFNK